MNTKKTSPHIKKPLKKSANTFPVIGVGASAGGLDAFKRLLKAIPQNSGMAYVLVQHLHPGHESMLPDILQKVAKIPVLEITDNIHVEPDHIYIIPSNKMLIVNDGSLELSDRKQRKKAQAGTTEHRAPLPIDLFFSSLAEVHQSHAIGVVLSGTGSDGTKGLKVIKDYGGVTFAQDEASAAYEGMPQSAVHAGVVDFILPPEEIPPKIAEITQIHNGKDTGDDDAPVGNEEVFKQILSLIRVRRGTDFTYYKKSTVRRRILRRMALNKIDKPAAYLKFLRENKPEQDVLFQDLLIPVTEFFRDSKTFDHLCETIFPQLIKNKSQHATVRIWVAGCSTGEEVYSIAICLKEFLGNRSERIQLFATDISEPAIAKARTGMYKKSELEGISSQRLHEFFTKTDGHYQVNKHIRDLCVFAVHNFLKDPPFGKMDLISCRNVLIYMEPYLQKKALGAFHYALNPKGYLLLGKSETISAVPDLFAAAVKQDKLFVRKEAPGRLIPPISSHSEKHFQFQDTNTSTKTSGTDYQKSADDLVLNKYAPVGVVTNEAMDIVHFRGKTGDYLEQSPGKPNLNIVKMAKHGMGFEIRNLLHKAQKENDTAKKENIPVKINGGSRMVTIEAIPLPNLAEPHYLVLFHEGPNKKQEQEAKDKLKQNKGSKSKKDEKSLRIEQLERELEQTHEAMRSITEDQEAANEELQSANEELVSSSEELQSLNEELETGKEELQSTNEELTIVNQELISLNEQLTEERIYTDAIIGTLREPFVVLDKNLRVKSANQSFYKRFQVNEKDTEGRLIYELGNNQWDIPALRTMLEKILPEKNIITDFEVSHDFPSIGKRIMILNAREIFWESRMEKLILLSFEDLTEKREADNRGNMLSAIVDSSEDAIISKTLEGVITSWNYGAEKIFGYTAKEAIGKNITMLLPPELLQDEEMIISNIKNGKPILHFDTVRLHKDGTRINISLTISPVKNKEGKIIGASKVARDISEGVANREQIDANEKKLRSIFLNTPAAIAMLEGPELTYKLVNPLYEKMFGRSRENLMGKSLRQAFPEVEGQQIFELAESIYQSGEAYAAAEHEMMIDRDGDGKAEQGFFNYSVSPLKDNNGKTTSLLIHVYDITRQVALRMQIEKSEQKFRSLIEEAPVATCLFTGREMKIEIANEKMIAIWGKGPNVIGKPLAEALPELEGQPFLEILVNVFTSGETYEALGMRCDLVIEGVKGTYYFDFIYKPLYNESDEVYGIMDMALDVTDQIISRRKIEESEENFRQLAELMPEKVSVADAQGNIIYYNNIWLHYTGCSMEELMEGWEEVIHPDDLPALSETWQYSLQTGSNFDMEFRIRHKSGDYCWHVCRSIAYKDEEGKIQKWIAATTEIQEQKDELKRKDDFLKMVSHELKTPITSMKGYVQLLLSVIDETHEASLPMPVRSSLIRVDNQIKRLTRLITEMLDLSRINEGRLDMNMENFRLNKLVKDMVADVLQSNPDRTIDYSEECKASIEADKNRIEQLILNILTNAIKYSPDDTSIEIKIFEVENNNVSISISDYGVGIDPRDHQKIFERFYRSKWENEKTYSGFGIGLYLANEIVERHNGTIEVESRQDKGSTFTITLPAIAITETE